MLPLCSIFFLCILFLIPAAAIEQLVTDFTVDTGLIPQYWQYSEANDNYFNLMKKALMGNLFTTQFRERVQRLMGYPSDGFPALGLTMLSETGMENFRGMIDEVIHNDIQGDILELGVWRGGNSIYGTAAVEHAMRRRNNPNDKQRTFYVLDSFQGLPIASSDKDDDNWYDSIALKVSLNEVMGVFRRYLGQTIPLLSLSDDAPPASPVIVRFVPGFVRVSLPGLVKHFSSRDDYLVNTSGEVVERISAPIAILRIDLDMYEAYMDTLFHLADRVPVGRFFIMDDYSCVAEAKNAVDEFRKWHGITEVIHKSTFS